MLVVVAGYRCKNAGMEWARVEGAPTGAFDRCRSTVPDGSDGSDTPWAVLSARTEERVIVASQE